MQYLANMNKANALVQEKKLVGNGQCVALIHAVTHIPATVAWQKGEQVKDNPHILPGTSLRPSIAMGAMAITRTAPVMQRFFCVTLQTELSCLISGKAMERKLITSLSSELSLSTGPEVKRWTKEKVIMSSSKWLLLATTVTIAMTSHANQPHRYECPAFLVGGHSKHAFLNVELFDTPPENKVSLMGGEIKNGTEWGISRNSDIYMVCGYKGTDKTILVHAPGVSIYRATTPPPIAYCD